MPAESILIVEDDASITNVLSRFLDAAGYATTSVRDGRAALDVLHQGVCPSVLLVDLMMPVMSGWELIERLRRDVTLSEIPIVVISGYPRLVAPAKLKDANVPLVEKPFRLDDLLHTIRSVARPSSSRWEIRRG